MAVSITDRLTAAIRLADQAIANAQYQADHINWTEARTVMLAARDELAKPRIADPLNLQPFAEPRPDYSATVKIDGRTKAARDAKAANG